MCEFSDFRFLSRSFLISFIFQAAFDWPLGQIGKIKQKYQKSKTNPTRSKSDANIAASSQRYLKRRGSERHGKGAEARSRKVAFEDQREVPWWNFPMRLMKNSDVSKSTGNLLKKKRTRHSTDPESSKDQGYSSAKQNNISRHILLLI